MNVTRVASEDDHAGFIRNARMDGRLVEQNATLYEVADGLMETASGDVPYFSIHYQCDDRRHHVTFVNAGHTMPGIWDLKKGDRIRVTFADWIVAEIYGHDGQCLYTYD